MPEPSQTLTLEEARRLVADLVERVQGATPAWTGTDDADPGIAVLDLFGFLADTLLYRTSGFSERGDASLRSTLERLGRREADSRGVFVTVDGRPWGEVSDLSNQSSSDEVFTAELGTDGDAVILFGDGVHGRRPSDGSLVAATYRNGSGRAAVTVVSRWPFDRCEAITVSARGNTVRFDGNRADGVAAIRRVRYFAGQLLSADDFLAEQTYLRDKMRRHNRALHGYGIVEGLDVTVTSAGLHLSEGIALDPRGHEIVVDTPQDLALPEGSGQAYVSLCYAELQVSPVPVSGGDNVQCSRIEETFNVVVAEAPSEGGVALARLVKEAEAWRVDADISPPRAR